MRFGIDEHHRLFSVVTSQKISQKILEDDDIDAPVVEIKTRRSAIEAVLVPAAKGDKPSKIETEIDMIPLCTRPTSMQCKIISFQWTNLKKFLS